MPALQERVAPGGRLFDLGGERTLDDVLVEMLGDASRGDATPCVVCGAVAITLSRDDRLECSSCGSRVEPGSQ
jgi:hypothetical protein